MESMGKGDVSMESGKEYVEVERCENIMVK